MTRSDWSGHHSQVIVTRVVSEFDKKKFDTSTNTSEDEREDGEEEGEEEGVTVKEEDKMSSVTSASCQCKQPERERFISRMV